MAPTRRIGQAALASLVATSMLWASTGTASAPGRIDDGAAAPECQAQRFRDIYPLDDDQYEVDQRAKFGLPTDPATRDRADRETKQRGFDNTVEVGVTLTDEEDAAFRLFTDFTERLQPLRDYFESVPDVTAVVAFNFDYLDPLFTIQTLPEISAEQLAEVERLTPVDIPTVAATVEWTYAELLTLLYDIGAGARGEATTTDAIERIESVGLVPHGASLGAEQYVTVYVDDSDLGCDAQLTALAANAVSDLDLPPMVIEQSDRASDDLEG